MIREATQADKEDISLEFHLTMGFKEANRIICFKKTYEAIKRGR